MGKVVDLVGLKKGKLTVLERLYKESSNGKKITFYKCICDCGIEKNISHSKLNDKVRPTQSCGCLKNKPKHGLSNSRIHSIWRAVKQRCNNPNSSGYANYGGRGISICDEWLDSFEEFYKWSFENGYSDDLTIDRIDVNGNYCPENCRWATYSEQINNRRNNVYITIDDDTKTLSQWCVSLNLNRNMVNSRLLDGWSIEESLNLKERIGKKKNIFITIDGVSKNVNQWCNIYSISRNIVYPRLNKGWSPEEALGIVERKK